MPGIVTNGGHEDGGTNEVITSEMNGNQSPSKDNLTSVKSPRRESSGQNHTADRVVEVEPSIEQLYEHVCDMQSSDQSPSRRSFGSDGDESRIDSELHHLVGGRMREVEIMEEEVEKERSLQGNSSGEMSSRARSVSNDKKLDKVDANPEIQSAATSSASSEKSVKTSKPKGGKSIAKSTAKSPAKSPAKTPRKPPASPKPVRGVTGLKKSKNSPLTKLVSNRQSDNSAESVLDDPEQAPILLRQARNLMSSGDNPQKALGLALQALKLFENFSDGKPSLELVMCLHVTAAIYCNLGQYDEAIPMLERLIEIPDIEEGQEHALGKFAGYMQLGDTYAMLGQLKNSVMCYTTGFEIQRQVLGETDPRVGETCRYVAEANLQAVQFNEAERLCQMALDIHKANSSAPSLEEAADRRLMALICETRGNHEAALEHLVLASMAMTANALTVFKTCKGENHPAVGTVFVRLADLYNRTGKLRESKLHCESALKIYENPMAGVPPEEIASGLTNVSAIYESMNELDQALKLLQKALEMYNDAPYQQSTIAGIEAQIGVMCYMLGNYAESYNSLKNAISKFRAIGEKKSAFFGIALNQMGLACVQRYALSEATSLFEEAKDILEHEYGPYHPDTLGVYSNLAGTYDAIGRLEDAIQLLEFVVGMREEKLGTANPDVDEEKRRLNELLKEAGRVRSTKARSLETLLDSNAPPPSSSSSSVNKLVINA
ncbi:hypothetical protein PIB30_062262 [Stylosanthes scabra]|uniref:Uncharacterized protein n=1 Tax=Stylosanthes scabra TaxID=79078 RepID=A0ABU6ZJW6_9FABA|nr:hypothetical protein [Stylosanthes scabra]